MARVYSRGVLRATGLSVYTVMLCAAVFALAFTSGFPYLGAAGYAAGLNYYSTPGGYTLISSASPVPLTSTVALPGGLGRCSTYSGEIAFPSTADGVSTLTRGFEPANASKIMGYRLVSGSWPGPGPAPEAALGSALAARLGVSVGATVELVDTLTGGELAVNVTGIYVTPYPELNSEAAVTLQFASAFTSIAPGRYSYIRVVPSYSAVCTHAAATLPKSLSNASAAALTVPEVAARLRGTGLASPQRTSSVYAVYTGAAPLVNSLAAVAALIILASSASLWAASRLYLRSVKPALTTLREQGASPHTLTALVFAPAAPLAACAAACGVYASSLLLPAAGLSGPITYALGGFPGALIALFIACALAPVYASLLSGVFGGDYA